MVRYTNREVKQMSTLKNELITYINDIPDDKLKAIKPLLLMMYDDSITLEKIDYSDLTEDEKVSIFKAEQEFANSETTSHDNINWD